MAPRGTSLGIDFDDVAIVPVATGLRMFDQSSLFRIMAQAADAALGAGGAGPDAKDLEGPA